MQKEDVLNQISDQSLINNSKAEYEGFVFTPKRSKIIFYCITCAIPKVDRLLMQMAANF